MMSNIELPKVLVFTVTYEGKDYVFDEFLKHVEATSYPKSHYRHVWIDNSEEDGYYNKLKGLGLEVYKTPRGNNSREALARGQEFARRMALSEGYDYLLSLESDILAPPDYIQRLLGAGKDVAGALYFIGDEDTRVPCITVTTRHDNGLKGTRLLNKDEFPLYMMNGLLPVVNCGLGCTLISREVFSKVSFYYYTDLKTHSDSFFATDVWRKGFQVFVDTNYLVLHKNSPWAMVKDR
jgi:GT2 family glycosyltransferase